VQSDGTVQHKQFEIARIMRRFPGRRFVLIGDSGEHDPEVYRRVKEEFGAQVQEIIIRDVTNARTLKPARLSGMTIVEAPTPVAGMSQSHSQIRTVLERRP
jgi:phosphatidate phosphatase APP1